MPEHDVLIPIPQALAVERAEPSAQIEPRACDAYCERVQCQNLCQSMCQNCLGTVCQSTCQTAGEGGCTSTCQSVCQNCLGDVCQSTCQSGCQSSEGCTTTCERTCQVCQGVPCQTCQDCQTGCEVSSQTVYAPPSISISGVTDSSASITVYPGSGYTKYRLFVRLTDNPSDVTFDEIVTTTAAFTRTVTGLAPNTSYTVNAAGVIGTVSDQWATAQTFKTKGLGVTPWSWTDSNGMATAGQTQAAYAILQGTRPADDFSHMVWNDLVDKVEEMRAALGGVWDTVGGKYLTASACKAAAGDTLRAAAYNSLKVNVGNIQSTGIQDVSPGDEITGYHITRVVDVLNSIIGGL